MILERICIGGPLNGTVKSDAFSCLAPVGYNLTKLTDGVEEYEFWTHKSLATEKDRQDAIMRFASEHIKGPDELDEPGHEPPPGSGSGPEHDRGNPEQVTGRVARG